MVYNTWTHWVFGHYPLSSILRTLENTTFWKLVLFSTSGMGEETPSLLGPLERANLSQQLALSNGPNRVGVSPH
jgi:hypothetical protein